MYCPQLAVPVAGSLMDGALGRDARALHDVGVRIHCLIEAIMTCILCQQDRPVARHLIAYDLDVCMPCFHAGTGNIHPDHEARFEELIRSKGIPLPARNGQGRYPLGPDRAVIVRPFQSSPMLAARRGC